jgi:hypothetical protein
LLDYSRVDFSVRGMLVAFASYQDERDLCFGKYTWTLYQCTFAANALPRHYVYSLIMSGTPARLSLTVTSYTVMAPSMRGTGASRAVLGHSITLVGFT